MLLRLVKQYITCRHENTRTQYFLDLQIVGKRPKPFREICLGCERQWECVERLEEIAL